MLVGFKDFYHGSGISFDEKHDYDVQIGHRIHIEFLNKGQLIYPRIIIHLFINMASRPFVSEKAIRFAAMFRPRSICRPLLTICFGGAS